MSKVHISYLKEVYDSDPDLQAIDIENQDFLQFISVQTGVERVSHVRDILQAQDALPTEVLLDKINYCSLLFPVKPQYVFLTVHYTEILQLNSP
jgi:hypothetical protein